jgi:hypothetical protein
MHVVAQALDLFLASEDDHDIARLESGFGTGIVLSMSTLAAASKRQDDESGALRNLGIGEGSTGDGRTARYF